MLHASLCTVRRRAVTRTYNTSFWFLRLCNYDGRMYPTGFVVSHATLTVHAIKLTLSVHEYSITIRVTTTDQTECQRWQHMQNGYQLIVCEVGVRGNRNTWRIASWVGENVEHSKLTLFLHAVWAVHCLVHTHGPSYEPSGVSAKRAYKRRGIVSDSHSINKAQEKYMQHQDSKHKLVAIRHTQSSGQPRYLHLDV